MPHVLTSPHPLPRAPEFDSTLALLREGYRFGIHRFDALDTDVFQTRMGMARVTWARGREAAAMFYHPGRFTRRGATPPNTLTLLQDYRSVQRLDGDAHRHRKAMFRQLLDAAGIERMVSIFQNEWDRQAAAWARQGEVVLHPQVEGVLCRTVCRWAGVPLPDAEADHRARQFGAMIDGAGSFGPRFLRGAWQRHQVERWIQHEIRRIRSGGEATGTPARVVAWHRDSDGALIDERTAVVELINLLRPTVAVARWITFAVLALHEHPGLVTRLRSREAGLLRAMAQEVRRYYPFFPAVGGRVREPFDWRGHHFRPGERMMLDLYGTQHDPRLWPAPDRFDPNRFLARSGTPDDLVPQGAGDVARGHRCPGEEPSIALLMAGLDALATRMHYRMPPQPLHYRMDRFPSIPESRIVMRDVRI